MNNHLAQGSIGAICLTHPEYSYVHQETTGRIISRVKILRRFQSKAPGARCLSMALNSGPFKFTKIMLSRRTYPLESDAAN